MVEALTSTGPGSPPVQRPEALRWTVAYVTLASAITYTQVHGWFVLLAHACTVGTCLIIHRRRAERLSLHWLYAMLGVVAIFLLWLPVFAQQVRLVQAGFWIPVPESDGLLAALDLRPEWAFERAA